MSILGNCPPRASSVKPLLTLYWRYETKTSRIASRKWLSVKNLSRKTERKLGRF